MFPWANKTQRGKALKLRLQQNVARKSLAKIEANLKAKVTT